MSELAAVTSLHEKAVQRVARGDVVRLTRGRRVLGPRRPNVTRWGMEVEPDVWNVAIHLAASRAHIEIISETEVIVWNHPAPWPKRE